MRTIYLISCVSKKLTSTAPAMNMYQSTWFKKAWRYCLNHKLSWSEIYILSAKYGAIPPNRLINPYDQTLNSMSLELRIKWAQFVFTQLHFDLRDFSDCKFVFFAGNKYREHLVPLLKEHGGTVSTPLSSMGIGQQMAWLDTHYNVMEEV